MACKPSTWCCTPNQHAHCLYQVQARSHKINEYPIPHAPSFDLLLPLTPTQVQPAPGPEEVNWEALWFNHSQRRLRQFLTTPLAILVVFAPVSLLTSAISSLNTQFCSAVKWEFYCSSRSAISNILRGLVTGFLPSLLIILWQVRLRDGFRGVCSA